MEQQSEHSGQINLLNEQISILKNVKDTPKDNLPVNLNESIITELKSELNDNKV